MTDNTTNGRPVLVTTEYRGVFFGYAEDTSGDTVILTNARNCIYWPSANGGFMGLASEGPATDARIGARVGQRQNLAPCLRLGEAFCRHELHQFATKVRYSALLCHQ